MFFFCFLFFFVSCFCSFKTLDNQRIWSSIRNDVAENGCGVFGNIENIHRVVSTIPMGLLDCYCNCAWREVYCVFRVFISASLITKSWFGIVLAFRKPISSSCVSCIFTMSLVIILCKLETPLSIWLTFMLTYVSLWLIFCRVLFWTTRFSIYQLRIASVEETFLSTYRFLWYLCWELSIGGK